MAVLASYIAGLCDWSEYLAPGERASLPIMPASTWQAGKAMNYLRGVFSTVPALKKLVTNETADTISLTTRVDIECRPASFRTSRGGTLVAAIGDEVAFWRNENSANPDKEILASLRPGLATTDGMLICISSPYAKKGELYAAHKDNYGDKGDKLIIVAQAPTRVMNPSLSAKTVARAYVKDPESAKAEYGAEFRSDISHFISRDIVEACVVPGRFELPRIPGVRYAGFVDPSGGSSDAMTLAIGHREGETILIDALRVAQPPFLPDGVTAEFAALLKSYGLATVMGDGYGGEWPRERFRVHGIEYALSDKPKSGLYLDFLPTLNSGLVELLDHKRLLDELCGLERRTARGGKDSIDHAPNAHDDALNAVAGVVNMLAQPFEAPCATYGTYSAATSRRVQLSNLSGVYGNA